MPLDPPSFDEQIKAIAPYLPVAGVASAFAMWRARNKRKWTWIAHGAIALSVTPIVGLLVFEMYPQRVWLSFACGGFAGTVAVQLIDLLLDALTVKLGLPVPSRRKEDGGSK